ncbi:hypothetical protein GCM10023084_03170 [Streptomyces lacrimifluminis]|uniref:hypothetical protein n=1 Tax=Streptomyces lacrimifluminis TaxID=1500077 RepID=UPI0031E69495
MTALRPATLDEYLIWLRAWLDAGNQPTHAYDYPWAQRTWLTATRDFRLGGECGSDAVHILVQPGIRHVGGGLGHNNLYLADGPEQRGGTVPVFSDPAFEMLPGVREFIADERRKTVEWKQERADADAARKLAAVSSDVPRRPASSEEKTG